MKLCTHTCRAVGCQHVISARLLMCLDHWHMVPAPLRREVVRLSKYRFADQCDRNGMFDQYVDAVRRAVAAVQEKQERKAAASAGPSDSLFT